MKMSFKKLLLLCMALFMLFSCDERGNNILVEEVISFKGLQVTGVTVSNEGRIFASFPRWRAFNPVSVVEIDAENGTYSAYPDSSLNAWSYTKDVVDDEFLAIQSLVADGDELYILDTRNPFFIGVQDAPRIYVIDLRTNTWIDTYFIDEQAVKPNSYVNDLRIDKRKGKIYMTDSGAPGLIIYDIVNSSSRRILDDHVSTRAEVDHLTINGQEWKNTVHSDGIALDRRKGLLYYHALTGYTLYALPVKVLDKNDADIEVEVMEIAKTPAPDGMIVDKKGNLYFADLENHKIHRLNKKGEIQTVKACDYIRWADTFSIHHGWLYYTNSRIHEAGADISDMSFSICKVKI